MAGRPTRVMMLAVNAAIDGNKAEVERLVKEYKLDRSELRDRMDARNGTRYEFAGPGSPRSRGAGVKRMARSRTQAPEISVTIDGRTSVRVLFKLIEQAEQIRARAQQELARRRPEEIEPVKKMLGEIELLRRERDKLESKIREAEEAMG